MNIGNITPKVKKIDRGKEFQIYKECCLLGAGYNKALRAVDLRVMLEVCSYLNHESFSAFPGINTLLNTLPISRRTLFYSLDKLESESHLARHRRWNQAKRRSDSTVYIPLIPAKVMPALRIRFANQPDALIVLARAAKSESAKIAPGSAVEIALGSAVEIAPEPLTEPLKEPLSYTGVDRGSPPISDNQFSDSREGKDKRSGEGSKEGLAEIYRIARKYWGERGAGIVAKALPGRSEAEILAALDEGLEAGADGDADYLAWALLSGDFQQ
jgi:hypothetical protein